MHGTSISYLKFFLLVLKINVSNFGSGQLAIALYDQEFVTPGYLDELKFDEIALMSNVFPGGVVLYLAGLTGNALFGKKGLFIGVLTTSFVPALLGLGLLKLLTLLPIEIGNVIILILPVLYIVVFEYIKKTFLMKISIMKKMIIFVSGLIVLMVFSLPVIYLIFIFVFIILIILRINKEVLVWYTFH